MKFYIDMWLLVILEIQANIFCTDLGTQNPPTLVPCIILECVWVGGGVSTKI